MLLRDGHDGECIERWRGRTNHGGTPALRNPEDSCGHRYAGQMAEFDPRSDYPIGTRRPDLVKTPGGLGIDDLTLERLRTGEVGDGEFRATPETLRLQAQVARAAERDQLADNLERAAELAYVPDHVILDLYTALRPRRSSTEELANWAERLERDYEAPAVAALVREAASAYGTRGLLT